MTLLPTTPELLARARGDLRLGLPVVLADGPARALVIAVEVMTEARLAALRAAGTPVLALTAWRARTLRARVYDGDIARIAVPPGETLGWLRALADPEGDLRHPMKGPLATLRDGRADLARAAVRLAKSAHLLPAALVVEGVADTPGLTAVPLAAVADDPSSLHPVIAARLPMQAAGAGRVHVFRPADGGDEHYAIEVGRPDRTGPVLVRLHSACFTGDVLGSLKCDCGPQLHAALARMGAEGAGILLYLNQEGRGIGLANKMRAYALQDQGFDTVEANHRLGFEDDERDFRTGAALLRQMGVAQVRLMTNNPRKIGVMEGCGIAVTERVPLHAGETPENRAYLATKIAKSGHLA